MTIVLSIGTDYRHARVERHEFADFGRLAEYVREQQPHGGYRGPYVCAPMLNGHRNADDAEPTSIVIPDFDSLPPEAPRRLCEAITAAGWRAALWSTRRSVPEAPRVRLVCELDRPVTKAEYAQVYRGLVRHLAESTGLALAADAACEKPEQPAVLPQPASTLWAQSEGVPLSVDAFLEYDPGDGEHVHDERHDRRPDDGRIGEGKRNEVLSGLAYKWRKAGLTVEEIAAALRVANRKRCNPALPDDEVQKIAEGKAKVEADAEPDCTLVAFDLAELLQPIPPERDLIAGMIPTEAYTVIAGALSSAKTTFLHTLALSRASGFDLLDLEAHIEAGPVVIVSYEDSDTRIRRRLLTCIQWAHEQITLKHGARAASQFLALVVKHVRRVTLTGQRGSALVCRDLHGNAAPNLQQIEMLYSNIHTFADRELLIGIDPLRLAFRGSQNDDDGADVAVETLNAIACHFPDSALVVPTHTTKAGAIEPGTDRAAQAYATSGSALYSQHARSNFHLARPKPDEARRLVHPEHVTEDEIAGQRVTVLSHARLSHGPERKALLFVMRKGVLVPVPSDQAETEYGRARRHMPAIAEAVQRVEALGGKATMAGLEGDPLLQRRGSRSELRRTIHEAVAQGWLDTSGKTKDRRVSLTDSGRQFSPDPAARKAQA